MAAASELDEPRRPDVAMDAADQPVAQPGVATAGTARRGGQRRDAARASSWSEALDIRSISERPAPSAVAALHLRSNAGDERQPTRPPHKNPWLRR